VTLAYPPPRCKPKNCQAGRAVLGGRGREVLDPQKQKLVVGEVDGVDNTELMERIERAIARVERATRELSVLEERLKREFQVLEMLAGQLEPKRPDAA